MAEFNPLDISATDTKNSLKSIYWEQRINSLKLASTIIQGLYRHELKRLNDDLFKDANGGNVAGICVTASQIDEIIVQLMQARRHISDADKSGAVLQVLKHIDV